MKNIENMSLSNLDIKMKMERKDKTTFEQLVRAMEGKSFHDFRTFTQRSSSQGYENMNEERIRMTFYLFLYAYTYGDIWRGKKAMEILLPQIHDPLVSKYYKSLIKNASFYMVPLYTQIVNNLKERHFPNSSNINPFLFRDLKTGGYVCGARIIQYGQWTPKGYEIYVFDKEGLLLNVFPMTIQFTHKRYERRHKFYGAEDIRVIPIPTNDGNYEVDRWLAVGTTLDTHVEGEIRMSLFYLEVGRDEKGNIDQVVAKDLTPLRGHEDEKDQKNWLPFFQKDEVGWKLYFVYKVAPLVILEAEKFNNEFTGKVKLVHTENCMVASKMRGNTPPIKWGNGDNPQSGNPKMDNWLFLIHNQAVEGIYYHRFMEMTPDFRIVRVSALFYFEQTDHVEFAVNMIPDGSEQFLISYGIKDKLARTCRVKRRDIEEFFKIREDVLKY